MILGEPPRRWAAGLWGVAVPSPTLAPWNTTTAYLIGAEGVGWIVDPGGAGSDAGAAIDAMLAASGTRTLKGVLLTHTHRDHVAGVADLARRHGVDDVRVHPAGVSRLVDLAGAAAKVRIRALTPGRRLTAGPVVVEAVATPGHARDHLAFWIDGARALVAGDIVAGEGSTWVGLPDGDVTEYLGSLAAAAALAPRLVAPAHGPVREDGPRVLDEARAHRLARERAVLAALRAGIGDLAGLREAVYPGLEAAAHDLAERSLLAHLRKLLHERRVVHLGAGETGPYAPDPRDASDPDDRSGP